MKLPFHNHNHKHNPSPPTSSPSLSKPLTPPPLSAAAATTAAAEPKSVLDLRRSRSPSPVAITHTSLPLSDDDDPYSDHLLINHQSENWESLMRELGFSDDSTAKPNPNNPQINSTIIPTSLFSPLPELFPQPATTTNTNHFVPADFGLVPDVPAYSAVPNLIHSTSSLDSISAGAGWNPAGFEFIDDLIRLAECFETNSLQLGHTILARLNQRLGSPAGEPLQRAAFYFKEALQSLLHGSPRQADSSEIIQTIKAQKTFSSISPIPMFSSFSANQALLEPLDGATNVHVIDFDIGLGGQWASFMKALADKADSGKAMPLPVLRISAVVPDEYGVESTLIRENLTQFARELNIIFEIAFISTKTFEYLNFQAIKFIHGEKIAVILSPVALHRVGTGFLSNLRQISPRVVVHVDTDGQMSSGTSSYRQAVIEGLEFYSTLLESLEAANLNSSSNGGDWMRRIEAYVVFPKILEMVEAEGRRGMTCKEALVAAGLRQVGVSQFAEFQAEFLVRRVQVRGFHAVKRQAELLLCWHDRPIVATSAWKY